MYSKKHYGYCGIIRKMDFEDRHPIIASFLAIFSIITLFIMMVII